jgi:hypothetical protein
MRLARPIVLNPESRRQLERQARGRTVPMRVALRSRIVLLAAEGKHLSFEEVGSTLGRSFAAYLPFPRWRERASWKPARRVG